MEVNQFSQEKKKQNPLKKWVIILGILCGLLLISTIYFGFIGKPVLNAEFTKTLEERISLQSELDELILEHNKIKDEYGELAEQLSEKDSVIMADAEQIKKLINSQADYNKIKKQLARLQNIAKEYVEEMDKLYQENKALREENIQVKETLAQEKEKVANIEKDKQQLTEKIYVASALKAYNISGVAVNVKSRNESETITDKAAKAKRFKTSFILSENTLIEPGPLNIYCRIAIPETGRILTPGSGESYSFSYNDQKLQYTAKTTINYTNKEESVTLYWDIRQGDKVAKGKYLVQVYTDDALLGETFFVLD